MYKFINQNRLGILNPVLYRPTIPNKKAFDIDTSVTSIELQICKENPHINRFITTFNSSTFLGAKTYSKFGNRSSGVDISKKGNLKEKRKKNSKKNLTNTKRKLKRKRSFDKENISGNGVLTNDVKTVKRQFSLGNKMEIKVSMFLPMENRQFQIPKTVSRTKKAEKTRKYRHGKKSGVFEGKTCQKAIQIFRRNYKKKRNCKMKKNQKSILKPKKDRKYKLSRSESLNTDMKSK